MILYYLADTEIQFMVEKKIIELEIWADSFKEGEFILERIQRVFKGSKILHKHGFVPTLTIMINFQTIEFFVYGYYDAWNDRPKKISNLLNYGKCDGIIYDPIADKIIFAYEETSAVPTGNQSLQRLERTWYAAHQKIPFVYLLGKFGLHKDGGTRQVSIWPSYLALKLSSQYKIPSLTLLYGSETKQEDYEEGTSMSHLQSLIAWYLNDHFDQNSGLLDYQNLLKIIYEEMCLFIKNHYQNISKNLAGANQLSDDKLYEYLKNRAISKSEEIKFTSNFKWELSTKAEEIEKKSFDDFINHIEKLIEQQKAWYPTEGSTIRSEEIEYVKTHAESQTRRKNKLEKKYKFKKHTTLDVDEFPTNDNGKKSIQTGKKILLLIDSTTDFLNCIEQAFGVKAKQSIEPVLNKDIPSVLYLTNSLQQNGRAFKGDPYTGQITAYSRIFSIGINGEKQRNMIAYYPNQMYSQFFDPNFKKLKNKGVMTLVENVDLIITRNGISINPKTWRLL
jgi:hypothetical protein